MTSNDREIYIEINGQPYVLRGREQSSSGAVDFQRAVLERLDKIDSRLSSLESRVGNLESQSGAIDTRLSKLETQVGNLESQVGELRYEQRLLHEKADMIQTSVYWGLAAIGIFLAVIAWLNRDKTSAPEKTSPTVITIPPAVDISALAQQVEELLLPKLKTKD